MTDKELLELAARAGGYTVVRWSDNGDALLLEGVQEPWSSLASDGDAFRLAVALRLRVECDNNGQAYVWKDGVLLWNEFALHVDVEAERRAAARRAITRAAAAIAQERGGNDQHNRKP